MKLSAAQQAVDRWIGQFEEGYWSPLSNLARLMEEVGELAREINDRYGDKKKKSSEAPADVANELGDVLWTVICLANSLDIDLDAVFSRTLHKVTTRDARRFTRRQQPKS